MQIKETAERLGLTEKAIRLYEDKGMISPPITEKNGRKFREYDEATVRQLSTIAGLRRSFFSLEQISRMQKDPDTIPQVFDEYLTELREQYRKLGDLLDRAEDLTPEHMKDAATLSDAMTSDTWNTNNGVNASSRHRTVMEFRFRIWDEDVTKDQRDEAYRRYLSYCTRWEKRYALELAFGKAFGFLKRHRKWITLGLVLFLVFHATLQIMIQTEYRQTFTGYRVVLNPGTGEYTLYPDRSPVSITFDGVLHRSIVRQDYYKGRIHLEGFHLISTYRKYDTMLSDGDVFRILYGQYDTGGYIRNLLDERLVDEDRSTVSAVYADLSPGKEFICLELYCTKARPWSDTYPVEYLIFPADSPEDATRQLTENILTPRNVE